MGQTRAFDDVGLMSHFAPKADIGRRFMSTRDSGPESESSGSSAFGPKALVTTFLVKQKNFGPHIQTFRAKADTGFQCHFPAWSSDGHWSNDL